LPALELFQYGFFLSDKKLVILFPLRDILI
jgi:hypothetical protein